VGSSTRLVVEISTDNRERVVDVDTEYLSKLRDALRYGHHEAIVITVDEAEKPHAAAMGVRLLNEGLAIFPYIDSRTYRNIKAGSPVSLLFTHNALIFCDVVLRPFKLRYVSGRNSGFYVLDADVDMHVEAVPKLIVEEGQRASVILSVLGVYEGRGRYFSYSRANSMLIEALVYLTKIRYFISSGYREIPELSRWIEMLSYSISLVRRLGSSDLVECAETVCKDLKDLGVGSVC